MAKVLFINPVVREEDVPKHVPYGIALLASIAMEKGHLVQIYDENAWRKGPEVLRQVLEADDWEVIAVGGITTAYASIKNIVTMSRDVHPGACIMLGGGVLTSLPKETMSWLAQVDVGAVGEAFETFPEMLDVVDCEIAADNTDWKSVDWTVIDGTVSWKDGNLAYGGERALIPELDALPYPAWDLFPLEEVYFPNSSILYSEEGYQATRRLDINGSFGCSMVCRYCYHLGLAGDLRYEKDDQGETKVAFDEPGKYTRVIRYHSPEYIVKMVKHIYDEYQVNFVAFLDENLMTMNRQSGGTWLPEICRLWEEYGLVPKPKEDGTWEGVYWSGTSHATLCDPELLKTMKEAGCSYLIYGYESFAPHVMKTIGKGATPKSNERSYRWTLEAGIRPIPNQIIGFPIEDFESIRQNMRAWDKLGIMVKPFFATAYPGSEWFTVNRESIEEQYDGDLEAYILDLGDATTITATISKNFNAVELYGLREAMVQRNYRMVDRYEAIWRDNHRIPEGAPSTLVEPKRKKRKRAPALRVLAS